MDIFISHISEDKKLPISVKEILEESFVDIDVFVSSDDEDITEKQRWFDSIEEALGKSKVMLIMCSDESVTRSWINFEAGAGWIKGIDVYPICYGDLKIENLPNPISSFPALSIHDEKFLKKLFKRISNSLNFDRSPPVHPKHSSTISNIREGENEFNLGLIDRVVRLSELSDEMEEVFGEYTSGTEKITEKAQRFREEIESSRGSEDEASSIFIKKRSESFADNIDSYSSDIRHFSEKLNNLLGVFDEDISYIVEYGSKAIENAESRDDLENIKYQFQVLKGSYKPAISKIMSFRDTINGMSEEASKIEGFQKDLTVSINELQEANKKLDNVLKEIESNFREMLGKSERKISEVEVKMKDVD